MKSDSLPDQEFQTISFENVEAWIAHDGKPRYKVQGITMAWCHSVAEAIRVACILSRSPLRAGSQRGCYC